MVDGRHLPVRHRSRDRVPVRHAQRRRGHRRRRAAALPRRWIRAAGRRCVRRRSRVRLPVQPHAGRGPAVRPAGRAGRLRSRRARPLRQLLAVPEPVRTRAGAGLRRGARLRRRHDGLPVRRGDADARRGRDRRHHHAEGPRLAAARCRRRAGDDGPGRDRRHAPHRPRPDPAARRRSDPVAGHAPPRLLRGDRFPHRRARGRRARGVATGRPRGRARPAADGGRRRRGLLHRDGPQRRPERLRPEPPHRRRARRPAGRHLDLHDTCRVLVRSGLGNRGRRRAGRSAP